MADHPHEQIAAVGDYLVALETYRAAVQRWPNVKITLRNRARVIEQSWGVTEPSLRQLVPPWWLASPDLRSDESFSRIRNDANQYSWAVWVKRARCVAVLALRHF